MGATTHHHPLDPLSAAEITAASAACAAHAAALGLRLRFNTVTLAEPPKVALLAHAAGAPAPPREAYCILQAPELVEALVSLGSGAASVREWAPAPGAQPPLTPDDCVEAEAVARADARVRALLAERLGPDFPTDRLVCDPWSVHAPPKELAARGARLVQLFTYCHMDAEGRDNAYAHPLDFVPVVDLAAGRVVRIDAPYEAAGAPAPAPPTRPVEYHRELAARAPPRVPLRALDVTQPAGGSWVLEGNKVRWANWELRVGFNYREGLVLHDVGVWDGNRLRPVAHRLSLVEMAVPYADPAEPFPRKCAFDVGDYGLGNCATSLELGCDCLGNIAYFDAILNDSRGAPVTVKKAICMHEEDAGLQWKHVEYRTGHSEARRARRLVISSIATVVNYEYAFYWIFNGDGSIEYEIKLTGELSTNAPSPGEDAGAPRHGTLVAPGVNAQHHQHCFVARLDLAVDDAAGGKHLAVAEVDVVPAAPGDADNAAGNVFRVVETPLASEAAAQRLADATRARSWKVSNPGARHPWTGKPVAYALVPEAAPPLLAAPTSAVGVKAGFAAKNLWVTPHADGQLWPAGKWTIMSDRGEGLPEWTAGDRDLRAAAGADPVLWYCFAVTHVVRPEDFPVMNCEKTGFKLKPSGFFANNPCAGLPAGANAASRLAGERACCADGDANGGAH